MPGLQFGSGAYARSGTPPITAAPFTWLICGRYDSLTGSQNTAAILCRSSTGGDHWQLRFDAAGSGAFRVATQQGGNGSHTITANMAAAGDPFVAIARVSSTSSREAILNGDLANKGLDTITKAPPGVDRISFGRKDDAGTTNDFEGVLFYSGLWNVALTDDEILALSAGAPVPRIRPAALMSWWVFDNASTVIDRLGRAPATISGGSLTDGDPRLYGTRRVYTVKTRARYLRLGTGSLALAGSSVALRPARKLPLATGAFALTGKTVALRPARKLPAGVGVLALTGRAITLRSTRKMPLVAASFVLAGKDMPLLHENTMAIGLPTLLDVKQAASVASLPSNSFATIAGALLLVFVKSRRVAAIPSDEISITDNVAGGPLAWEACVEDVIQGSQPSVRGKLFRAIAPGGNMAVTAAASNSARIALMVVQIERARIGILNVGRGISAAGDPAVLLEFEPESTSIVLGFGGFSGTADVPSPLAAQLPLFKPGGVMTLAASYTRIDPPQAVEWETDNTNSVGLAIEVEAREHKLEPGAFALAGRDVALRYARRLPLDAGALAIAAPDVALRRGYAMALGTGVVALGGREIEIKRGYVMRLEAGAFVMAGQAITLCHGTSMALGAGSFSLTGQGLLLLATRRLALEPLQLSLAAEAVGMAAARRLDLGARAFSLSGASIDLTYGRNLPMAAGSLALAGQGIAMRAGRVLRLGVGSFGLTGRDLTMRRGVGTEFDAGSFALTGQAVALRAARRLALGAGSFGLAGQNAVLRHGYSLALAAGSFGVTGQGIAMRATRRMPIGAASYGLAGQAVAFRAARRVALAAATYSLTGQVVGMAAGRRMALGQGSASLTGVAVALRAARRIGLGTATLQLAGSDAALRRTAVLRLGAGALSLTGRDLELVAPRHLILGAGVLALAGVPVVPRVARRMPLAVGAFSLTGQAVTLRRAARLPLSAGTLTMSGWPAGSRHGYAMRLDPATFGLAGQPISLARGTAQGLRPRHHLRGSYQILVPLMGEIASPATIPLQGEYRLTCSLGAASLPAQVAGEVELLSGQDVTIRRNQYAILDFTVAGGAGCTAAAWYCAEKASAVPDDVLIEVTNLTSPAATLEDAGGDLRVRVPLTEAQTEGLQAGRLFHQLWVTDAFNRSVPAAEGTLTVNDSLRS